MAQPDTSAPHAPFLRGAAWSAANAASGVALPFAVFILFARWLDPAQVGVTVLAMSASEIIKAFGMPGLYEALLQQGDGAKRHHQTAAAILLVTGVVLTLCFMGGIAAVGAWVPGVTAAGWVLKLIGLRIFFDLATLQPQAALAQRLAFGRMATRSIVANAGAGALGLTIAALGHPSEGLVLYLVAQSGLIFATTVIGTGAMVTPVLHRDCIVELRHEALPASVVRLVAALNNYLDQIVVAGVIGTTRLAFFNLGKRVETTFITAAASFSTILFQPLFSRRGDDPAKGLRNGLAMMTFVCGIPAAIVVTNADNVVATVFGARWQAAAPVVAILAVSGFARALGSVHGAMLSVSRRNRILMIVTSVSAASGIGLVGLTSGSGIAAVAGALAAKNIVMVGWMAALTRDQAPGPCAAYAKGVFLPWAIMIAAGYGAHLIAGQPGLAALAVSALTTVVAGLICLLPFMPIPRRRPVMTPQWSIETP